jgi:CYTH domain-containing protein
MIEIERKFLLKSIPDVKPSETIKINQWYLKVDGIWERARSMDSNVYGIKWVHTVKTRISEISNIEEERDLSKDEFDDFVKRCKDANMNARYIKKQRRIYPDGELKWEVDVFSLKCHIIVAEIEIPTEDYDLRIPDFIQKKNLLEVTGLKQFSNRSLSNRVKSNFR